MALGQDALKVVVNPRQSNLPNGKPRPHAKNGRKETSVLGSSVECGARVVYPIRSSFENSLELSAGRLRFCLKKSMFRISRRFGQVSQSVDKQFGLLAMAQFFQPETDPICCWIVGAQLGRTQDFEACHPSLSRKSLRSS